MKSRTLLSMAVAGAFVCSSAFAGGAHHSSHEVLTPMSVNESAPWLAAEPHTAGWSAPEATLTASMDQEQFGDSSSIGANSSASGAGSVGYDSTSSMESDPTIASGETVKYWL